MAARTKKKYDNSLLKGIDPFQIPPNIEIARNIGESFKLFEDDETRKLYPLCEKVDSLKNLDLSIQLYLKSHIMLILLSFSLIILYTIPFSILNMVLYFIENNYASQQTTAKKILSFLYQVFIYPAIQKNAPLFVFYNILLTIFLSVVVFVFSIIYAKKIENFYAKRHKLTPADFTLICYNYVPKYNIFLNKKRLIRDINDFLNTELKSLLVNMDFYYLSKLKKRKEFIQSQLSHSEGESVINFQSQLHEVETKIDLVYEQFQNDNHSLYNRVLFFTFETPGIAKDIYDHYKKYQKIRICSIIISILTFGIYRPNYNSNPTLKFFSQINLERGIEPGDVNWKYKIKHTFALSNLKFALIFLIVCGLSPYLVFTFYKISYRNYFLYSSANFSIFCILYFKYFFAKIFVMCVESISIVLIGYGMKITKHKYLRKTEWFKYFVLWYLGFGLMDYIILYSMLVYEGFVASEVKKSETYQIIIDYLIGPAAIVTMTFQPLLNKINFALISMLVKRIAVWKNPSNYNQTECIEIYMPWRHDTALGISYIGTMLALKCIYAIFNPVVYIFILLVLILNFWIEKYTILRYHKNPKNINFIVLIQIMILSSIMIVPIMSTLSYLFFNIYLGQGKHYYSQIIFIFIGAIEILIGLIYFKSNAIERRVRTQIYNKLEQCNNYLLQTYDKMKEHFNNEYKDFCPDDEVLSFQFILKKKSLNHNQIKNTHFFNNQNFNRKIISSSFSLYFHF